MEPFDTENFISEIQKRAILWNSHLPEYSNKVLKKNAWEEICLIFCANFEEKTSKEKNLSAIELQKKWKSIKDAHNRDKAKRNCSSGSGAKVKKPYVYSKLLTFLDPLADIRPPSQCSENSNPSDIEQEVSTDTENWEFSKPKPPKKLKKYNEDPQEKLYEALTAHLQRSNEATNSMDNPDKMFLLSLAPDFSTIKEEYKLEAKAEIINLIRKYKRMGTTYSAPFGDQHGFHSGYQQNYQPGYQPNYQPGYQSYQQLQGVEKSNTPSRSVTRDNTEETNVPGRSNLVDTDSTTNDSEIFTDLYD